MSISSEVVPICKYCSRLTIRPQTLVIFNNVMTFIPSILFTFFRWWMFHFGRKCPKKFVGLPVYSHMTYSLTECSVLDGINKSSIGHNPWMAYTVYM